MVEKFNDKKFKNTFLSVEAGVLLVGFVGFAFLVGLFQNFTAFDFESFILSFMWFFVPIVLLFWDIILIFFKRSHSSETMLGFKVGYTVFKVIVLLIFLALGFILNFAY